MRRGHGALKVEVVAIMMMGLLAITVIGCKTNQLIEKVVLNKERTVSENAEQAFEENIEENDVLQIECLNGNIEVQDFDKVATGSEVYLLSETVDAYDILEKKTEFENENMVAPSKLGDAEELNGLAVSNENGLALVEFLLDGVNGTGDTLVRTIKENEVYWYANYDNRLSCIIITDSEDKVSKMIDDLDKAVGEVEQ